MADDELALQCGKCGAEPNARCKTKDGGYLSRGYYHAARSLGVAGAHGAIVPGIELRRRKFVDSLVQDDPNPVLSRLDRLDGLRDTEALPCPLGCGFVGTTLPNGLWHWCSKARAELIGTYCGMPVVSMELPETYDSVPETELGAGTFRCEAVQGDGSPLPEVPSA